jgi:hypothetical protein
MQDVYDDIYDDYGNDCYDDYDDDYNVYDCYLQVQQLTGIYHVIIITLKYQTPVIL